jgi:hypothetical protein
MKEFMSKCPLVVTVRVINTASKTDPKYCHNHTCKYICKQINVEVYTIHAVLTLQQLLFCLLKIFLLKNGSKTKLKVNYISGLYSYVDT